MEPKTTMPQYVIPQITEAHIWDLLKHDNPEAVLYLRCGPDNDGGAPELDIWVEPHVPAHQVVLQRVSAIEVLDPFGTLLETGGSLEHMVPVYQDDVDRVFEEVYPVGEQQV